jgi:methylenetetrahydrofolate dehydrogenase (NADP+)/methenyltetrahydrofolate cyclohydrolase
MNDAPNPAPGGSARLIDGAAMAEELLAQVRRDAAELKSRGRQPYLYALEIGGSPASRAYMDSQKKRCQENGIRYEVGSLPLDSTTDEVIERVGELNANPKVSSIIIMTPVPAAIDLHRVRLTLDPGKDVEGLSPANIGLAVYGQQIVAPCTARSVMHLVRSTGVTIEGAEAVVVGASEVVGKPIALLLLKEMATVAVLNVATRDLAAHARRADILISAVGKAGLITADHVKPGAVVVDVGMNDIPVLDAAGKQVFGPDGRPKRRKVGDCDFDAVRKVAGWITPVPGGVGPMTVAFLLKHVVESATRMAESAT